MKLWFSLFSGILLQFRFPRKEPRHEAIRPCLGISLLLKSDPREDVNILLRGWVPPQSRTNVKLTLMFPSWKAVEQMVADTFFRNPGNLPVYPLRYEKKKKGGEGGIQKCGEERKWLGWDEPRRRPCCMGWWRRRTLHQQPGVGQQGRALAFSKVGHEATRRLRTTSILTKPVHWGHSFPWTFQRRVRVKAFQIFMIALK